MEIQTHKKMQLLEQILVISFFSFLSHISSPLVIFLTLWKDLNFLKFKSQASDFLLRFPSPLRLSLLLFA